MLKHIYINHLDNLKIKILTITIKMGCSENKMESGPIESAIPSTQPVDPVNDWSAPSESCEESATLNPQKT